MARKLSDVLQKPANVGEEISTAPAGMVPPTPAPTVLPPSQPNFNSLSLGPPPSALGTDADWRSQFMRSGVPVERIPPLPPQASIAQGSHIQSIVSAAIAANTPILTMPLEYFVATQGAHITVTWNAENASTALMGPAQALTSVLGTPYINYFNASSAGEPVTSATIAVNPAWPTWVSNVAYTVSTLVNTGAGHYSGRIIDSNGNIQTVIVGGTSTNGLHPTWKTATGAITIDNSVQWRNDGTAANILQVGDALVLGVEIDPDPTFITPGGNVVSTSVTDTLGNNWTLLNRLVTTSTGFNRDFTQEIWVATNKTGLVNSASYTITVNFSAACGAIGLLFSVINGLVNVDQKASHGATTGTTFGPGTVTTPSTEFVLLYEYSDNTLSSTPGGYTQYMRETGGGGNEMFYGIPAAGVQTPVFVQSSGGSSQATMITWNITSILATNVSGTPGFRHLVNTDLQYAIFGASGLNHEPGSVPDPGPIPGSSRFLCENATWATVPASIQINEVEIAGTYADFNGTTPAAPSGSQNVLFAQDTDTPVTHISASLPFPTVSAIGGVQAVLAVSHEWINAISTAGVPSLTQPAFTDISGIAAVAQGGTGANLSGTGGSHEFVKQSTSGGDFTVGTIASGDLPGDVAYLDVIQTWTAAQTFNSNKLILAGSSSGTTVLNAAATAGTTTATLPDNTGTIAELNFAQTWSAAQTFNNGFLVLAGSSSGTTALEASATAGTTVATFPDNTGTVAELNLAQTWTAGQNFGGTGIEVSGTLSTETETANIWIGNFGGTPRIIFGDSTQEHEIDVSSGIFRIYRPGDADFQIDTTGVTTFFHNPIINVNSGAALDITSGDPGSYSQIVLQTTGSVVSTWLNQAIGSVGTPRYLIYDNTNGREDFTILFSTGFVGILNSNPSYQLDVNGDINTSGVYRVGGVAQGVPTNYVPTVTSSGGTITSYTAYGTYTIVGKRVDFSCSISITNNGTGSGELNVSTPTPVGGQNGSRSFCQGRENSVTGLFLQGIIFPSSSLIQVFALNGNVTNAYPGGSGYLVEISGSYEST